LSWSIFTNYQEHELIWKFAMKAIAYGELSKPEHLGLIRTSISDAKDLLPRFTGVTLEELAVEIAVGTVLL
jgi:hypothetical protein